MNKYRMEERKFGEEWNPFFEYTDWDSAYKIWQEEYSKRDDFFDHKDMRMIYIDENKSETFIEIDNCLLYDSFIKNARKKRAMRNAILANISYVVESMDELQKDIEMGNIIGISYKLFPILEKKLMDIIDNLEEIKGDFND